MIKKMRLIILGMMTALGAFGDPLPDGGPYVETVSGVEWTFRVSGGEARVMSANGKTGALEIPSLLGGRSVTSVCGTCGDRLTSVTIPSGVTNIEVMAFAGCTGLTAFVVDESNQHYKSENGLLLSKDGTLLVKGVNGSGNIVIPSSVLIVGYLAFADCRGCTSVTIPSSVTNIEMGAFSSCTGLRAFVVDESNQHYKSENGLLLSKDGTRLIAGVNGDVVIPSGVVSIRNGAFYGNSALISVTMPSSVTDIGSDAFSGCDALEAIRVSPGDAERVRELLASSNPMLDMTKLQIVECLPDGGPYAETVSGVEWTFEISDGIAKILAVDARIGAIEVPSSLGGCKVKEIGEYAFETCSALESVTIPDCVTRIGESAFYNCSALKDVTFDGGSCDFSVHAFVDCHWDLIFHVPADWSGRGNTLFGYTVIRDGGVLAPGNVNLTITNVVVHYVLNSIQPDIAVPISGDAGIVVVVAEVQSSGAVSVPSEWAANYPSFTTKYGSDFGKALMKRSGKRDSAGNEMLVWQDFVAGTDPTDPDDKFTASITLVDGLPVISYSPELTDEQKALRVYKTYGKVRLQDENGSDITDLDGDGRSAYNFFKVTVEMR